MTLSEKQSIFSANLAKLILWANEKPGVRVRIDGVARTRSQQILYYTGYEIVLGKYGGPVTKCTGKIRTKTLHSKHLQRLAGDLILDLQSEFSDPHGRWQYQTRTEAYKFLGDYWKTLHSRNVWGGDFKGFPDGNHFEMK